MPVDSNQNRRTTLLTRREALAGIAVGAAITLASQSRSSNQSGATRISRPGEIASLSDYGRLGTADDTAVFNAAIADAKKNKTAGLRIPPGTYNVSSTLELDVDDFQLLGKDATIASAMTAGQPLISVDGNGISIIGLRTVLTAQETKSHHYRVSGRNCRIDLCTMEYITDQNTPAFYVRGGDGFTLTNSTKRGSNAFIGFLEASNVVIAGNRIYGTMIGDDAIAIKAIERPSENIRITGNYIYRHAAILSIGSQVGMVRADDPAHSRWVRNVVVDGNTAEECARMAFIKPGALRQDYRDGLVENIVFTNNVLRDETGAKFRTGFDIRAGHGAIVRDVRGTNNSIRARANGDSSKGRMVGALSIRTSGGGSMATIENIDLDIGFDDPRNGAPNGPADPGYPVENVVRIDPQDLNLGKVDLRIDGNGCSESGVLVLPGADGKVTFEKLKLSHYNARNSDRNGGIRTGSLVTLTQDVSMSGNGRARIVDAGGSFATKTVVR